MRLPFGLKNAPEEFQFVNNSIFSGIDNVHVYFDEILIAAENEIEHDKIMEQVINRARYVNIKFNKNKLQYKVTV